MKSFKALADTFKKTKDDVAKEHLIVNEYRNQLEGLCDKYLLDDDDKLQIECDDTSLPYVINILEEPSFLSKYEFEQTDEYTFWLRTKDIILD